MLANKIFLRLRLILFGFQKSRENDITFANMPLVLLNGFFENSSACRATNTKLVIIMTEKEKKRNKI